MSVAKIANLQVGSNQHVKEGGSQEPSMSNEEASELSGVGTTAVKNAKVISKSGTEELQQLVTDQNLSLELAAQLAKKTPYITFSANWVRVKRDLFRRTFRFSYSLTIS